MPNHAGQRAIAPVVVPMFRVALLTPGGIATIRRPIHPHNPQDVAVG